MAQNWNALRFEALRIALERFLYPMLESELKLVLLKESQDCVILVSAPACTHGVSEGGGFHASLCFKMPSLVTNLPPLLSVLVVYTGA